MLHVRPQSQVEAATSSKVKVLIKSPQEPQAVVLGHQDVYTFDKYELSALTTRKEAMHVMGVCINQTFAVLQCIWTGRQECLKPLPRDG